MTTEISPHVLLSEPQLAFSPTDSSSWEIHPLRGLLKYGPFSRRPNTESDKGGYPGTAWRE